VAEDLPLFVGPGYGHVEHLLLLLLDGDLEKLWRWLLHGGRLLLLLCVSRYHVGGHLVGRIPSCCPADRRGNEGRTVRGGATVDEHGPSVRE
jgi:hypothetical protein